jgi:hypothetical protein
MIDRFGASQREGGGGQSGRLASVGVLRWYVLGRSGL